MNDKKRCGERIMAEKEEVKEISVEIRNKGHVEMRDLYEITFFGIPTGIFLEGYGGMLCSIETALERIASGDMLKNGVHSFRAHNEVMKEEYRLRDRSRNAERVEDVICKIRYWMCGKIANRHRRHSKSGTAVSPQPKEK